MSLSMGYGHGRRDGELFSGQHFHDAAQSKKETLIREIQGYDMAAIIQNPTEKLAEYFYSRYMMDAPQLKRDNIYLLDTPKEVNAREQVKDMVFRDEYVNVNRSYISFTVCVPFEGDALLFDIQPTSRQFNMSRRMSASIDGNEIHISYQEEAKSQDDLEKLYEQDVNMIDTNAKRLQTDAGHFNSELLTLINQKINERKQKAGANQSIIQAFKIPIKRRDDIPKTYTIPEIRRKPSIVEPPKTKTFTPEPTLPIEEYEYILTIIKDVALAMERSPQTFAKLTEEEIRDFFLIQLNGHYQGNATGETFNGAGKTDILIRYKNANAFIAECKFWAGQKNMTEAIDQLLGYVTWRDTKTAILLFNKQPDLSAVLKKADEAVKGHKKFKSDFRLQSSDLTKNETIIPYRFVHPLDPEKDIYLTLLAFQITQPTPTESRQIK